VSSGKKICIATGIFPPDKGGPAQFASSFSSWLTSNRVPTTVVSLTDKSSSHTIADLLTIDLTSRKIRILQRMIKTSRVIKRASTNSTLLVNGLFLETLIASLTRRISYVAKIPGDIVWERARNTGRTSLDIDSFQGKEPLGLWLMRWAFTKSLKRAQQIISPSVHLKKIISNWGINEEKIVVIPNGVDTELFKPDLKMEKRYDLITVSRLVEWKGIGELIEAAALLNLRLMVVGSGPHEAALRKLAAESRANVDFIGEVEQTDLPKLINSARCFVLNSKYEGSPHSLIEAMSCGSFVVARSSTGTTELIDSGVDGILVPMDGKLVSYLSDELKDNKIRISMGEKAREKIVEKYSREKVFSDIYRLVIKA